MINPEQETQNAEMKSAEVIDLREVWNRIKTNKLLFVKVLAVTFILSCAYILCIPRTYHSEVVLAPETSSSSPAGGLSALAGSFGFDLGNMTSEDAIYPMLYPDMMGSKEFIVSLFDIQVTTEDGSLTTDYYTYLTKHQEHTPWHKPIHATIKFVKNLLGGEKKAAGRGTPGHPDPFMLSYDDYMLTEKISEFITCDVDKKYSTITISVDDQDRLICASLADSVRLRLQKVITEYRTRKARTDMLHYKQLAKEALADYNSKARSYAGYADSHQASVLASSNVTETSLENDMQTAYTLYTQYEQQANMFEGKVQENTPAFVVLKSATVPVKPAKPKRMIFVAAMLFLATIGTAFWVARREILSFA